MKGPSDIPGSDTTAGEPDALEAGAREIRWAPRVALHTIRRLYETDAMGIVDEEQIDEVGYALYARCRSVIDATDAHERGRVRCPRPECRAVIQRRGRPDRPEDDTEIIRCAACGWATTARAYRVTYRGKQLLAENALPAFEAFVREFEAAARPQQKMLAIDRLIHAVHGDLARGFVGRPAAVNVLRGTIREIFALLDGLAYGPETGPELLEGRDDWRTTRREAPRYSRTWQPASPAPGTLGGETPATHLAAQAVEVELPDTELGRYRRLVALLGPDVAHTMPELRVLANQVREALGEPHVIVLACRGEPGDGETEHRIGTHFLAFVSPPLVSIGLRADELVSRIARAVAGGGGGTPREAFGGGGDSTHLGDALASLF